MTRLYYGTFNPESTAYQKLVPEWEAAGIQVPMVLMPAPLITQFIRNAVISRGRAVVFSGGPCILWLWPGLRPGRLCKGDTACLHRVTVLHGLYIAAALTLLRAGGRSYGWAEQRHHSVRAEGDE